ncbi:cholesterol 7-desaturase nvd [Anastrepha ludens]|uniref:cholesterol 7-desaturase nvd n=1 Tax=Anastrepha ludens TaxID=28586 RepID=UPI0023B1CB13|nr:cholesterol 7-desaturase nvd [Anastrepha ludens]
MYMFVANYSAIAPELRSFITSYLTTIIIILIAVTFYWLFLVPCNWRKSLQGVSYSTVINIESLRRKLKSSKRDDINRIRRTRSIGLKELPPPYPNGWYCILESSLLKAQNVSYVSCLGEHFVVFRTVDGLVNVLDAYCPHLGANMGVGGRVNGDNIECPFHKWSFRGSDGTCVNIPYSSTEPKGIKVRKWICREINDNIFVWYHTEKENTQWELPVISSIEKKELIFHGRNEFYVNCHIQEIPENGADLAHFSAVHRACLFAGVENPEKSALAKFGQHHWQAVWKTSFVPKTHIASLHLTHAIQLLPKYNLLQIDVEAKQIGPSVVHLHLMSSTFGRIEILQTVTPVEPLVQKVIHRFYAHKAVGPFMKLLIFAESVMFERDIVMWNHKTFRSKPRLVKEDTAIKNFRNWFAQFYTENSKSFVDAHGCLDW